MLKSKSMVPLDIAIPQERGISVDQVNQKDSLSYVDSSASPILNSDLAPLIQEVFASMLSEARQDNIYAIFPTGREKFNITAERGVHALVQESIRAIDPVSSPDSSYLSAPQVDARLRATIERPPKEKQRT